jgi:catechol 2,3-dioxygenase-like lactoylglutathione lyase family enzyme
MWTGGFNGLSAIGQIAIVVQSLDRAVEFYRDRLGLPLLFQAPPSLAFFDAGGVRLMLSPSESGAAASASVLYFKVDHIEAAVEVLSGRGVVFRDRPHLIARMPDHELWMTFFNDSEGNVMGLMEERR